MMFRSSFLAVVLASVGLVAALPIGQNVPLVRRQGTDVVTITAIDENGNTLPPVIETVVLSSGTNTVPDTDIVTATPVDGTVAPGPIETVTIIDEDGNTSVEVVPVTSVDGTATDVVDATPVGENLAAGAQPTTVLLPVTFVDENGETVVTEVVATLSDGPSTVDPDQVIVTATPV